MGFSPFPRPYKGGKGKIFVVGKGSMIAPKFPTEVELEPFLAKLRENAGSVVIVAIEWPRDTQNFARLGIGWFDEKARQRLKRALRAEARRSAQTPSETLSDARA
jgi:hypothetical protein